MAKKRIEVREDIWKDVFKSQKEKFGLSDSDYADWKDWQTGIEDADAKCKKDEYGHIILDEGCTKDVKIFVDEYNKDKSLASGVVNPDKFKELYGEWELKEVLKRGLSGDAIGQNRYYRGLLLNQKPTDGGITDWATEVFSLKKKNKIVNDVLK